MLHVLRPSVVGASAWESCQDSSRAKAIGEKLDCNNSEPRQTRTTSRCTPLPPRPHTTSPPARLSATCLRRSRLVSTDLRSYPHLPPQSLNRAEKRPTARPSGTVEEIAFVSRRQHQQETWAPTCMYRVDRDTIPVPSPGARVTGISNGLRRIPRLRSSLGQTVLLLFLTCGTVVSGKGFARSTYLLARYLRRPRLACGMRIISANICAQRNSSAWSSAAR